MSPAKPDISSTIPIGTLPQEELELLLTETEDSIKGQRKTIVICLSLFWLIAPLIIAAIRAETLKKMQKRLKILQQGNVPVHKIQGELKFKSAARSEAGEAYFCYAGDYLLPQVVDDILSRSSGLKNFKGQTITFEVLPTLRINYRYYDGANRGYNFITNTSLDKA